jgi:hypothetical protein
MRRLVRKPVVLSAVGTASPIALLVHSPSRAASVTAVCLNLGRGCEQEVANRYPVVIMIASTC